MQNLLPTQIHMTVYIKKNHEFYCTMIVMSCVQLADGVLKECIYKKIFFFQNFQNLRNNSPLNTMCNIIIIQSQKWDVMHLRFLYGVYGIISVFFVFF
jgi:hypothetical protein